MQYGNICIIYIYYHNKEGLFSIGSFKSPQIVRRFLDIVDSKRMC